MLQQQSSAAHGSISRSHLFNDFVLGAAAIFSTFHDSVRYSAVLCGILVHRGTTLHKRLFHNNAGFVFFVIKLAVYNSGGVFIGQELQTERML